MKRPSFQFYPGDWLNDAALRMVSVGARGLWIDMICLMHQGSDYGYLKVNGKVILNANLARMCGSTLHEVEGWIKELQDAGVFSVDDDGCIFSRRMIRDEQVRQSRASGGIKGGNPALLKKKNEKEKDNLPLNLTPTPSSSSSSSSSSKVKGTRLPIDWEMPAEWGDWALDEKPDWDNARVLQVAAKFKDHWISTTKNPTKTNWFATWRNWVRDTK